MYHQVRKAMKTAKQMKEVAETIESWTPASFAKLSAMQVRPSGALRRKESRRGDGLPARLAARARPPCGAPVFGARRGRRSDFLDYDYIDIPVVST